MEEKAKEEFVYSIGENAETMRKALNDKPLQDEFIAAIDEDPQLVKVLENITPNPDRVAADWGCCRKAFVK